MAHEFANPQLALREHVARLGIALMASTRHDRSECSSCPDRSVHPNTLRKNRPGDGLSARDPSSERALHRLHPVALDDVAGLHVLIIFEGHAALLSGNHFARIVLEALELGKLALVHDHAVADETYIGAALHHSVGDAATGHISDLGNFEDLQD